MQRDDLQARLGGRYVIDRELGRGGMGTVYLARDVRLDRPVALKVLPAEYAHQTALRERFVRETRTAAGFSHPNIVPVYAVEETEDLLAYAMAYVEGETLTDRVKRAGPLPIRDVVRLLQDVGYALAYAHGREVVHRDIKPDNVMIERATGRALVMDFGIARVIAAPDAPAKEGLTRVGEVVGTPEYMSPEQATGDHVDGRSDLYALGLVAFFALTGRRAMSGETTGKVLAQQITTPLPDIRALRPDVPAPLVEAVEKCTAKDPAARFPKAESLVEALDAAQLAAPEIPLTVRLFANELEGLSLVLAGGVLVTYLLVRLQQTDEGDWSLFVVVLFAALLTRVLQTMREAGRVAASGFGVDDVQRGLVAVLAERETRRAELRADEDVRRARRRTLWWSIAMLLIAVGAFRWALEYRFLVAPGRHRVTPAGSVLVLTALILFGVSLALLARSPFRPPFGERFFRLVWLGPIGRWFLRFASRKVKVPTTVTTWSARIEHTPAAAPVALPGHQHGALEARVLELERWRKEISTRP
jgi:eukaryotic-like serine/threonine-protein kinase